MAKKYLAFQDDLAQVSNTDLVIKPSGNSTALADLALGTSIYIPETLLSETNNVEYIVVEKWNGIVTVMRKELTPSTISNNCYYLITFNYSTAYSSCNAHTWLTGEFLTRFSSGIKDNFTNKAIMVYTNTTINAKVFLPSLYELGINNYGTYGYTQWFSSDAERIAYYNNTAYFYLTRNCGYNTGYGVSSSGAVATGDTGRLRPCIALTQTATVDADNILQPAGKSFLGTLEDVQDGDYFYKFKDIDGRVSSNITYDNTTSGLTASNVKAAIDEVASDIGDKIDAPSSPSDGQILQYSSSGSAWVAASPAGGFIAQSTAPSDTSLLWIDTDDDTSTDFPQGSAVGDLLVWNGTEWVAKPKWQACYQPVEYIESTGTQIIYTGVFPSDNTRIVEENAQTDITALSREGVQWLFDSSDNGVFSYGTTSAVDTFRSRIGVAGVSEWRSTGISVDTNKHKWDLSSGSQKFDNQEYATDSFPSTTITGDICVFGRKLDLNPNNDEHAKLKVYSCKIYDGQTLVRNFVPVRSIATGEGGLYDTVENKFYGNDGTGTFTKGADV